MTGLHERSEKIFRLVHGSVIKAVTVKTCQCIPAEEYFQIKVYRIETGILYVPEILLNIRVLRIHIYRSYCLNSNLHLMTFSKSDAGCLHTGHIKSAGS